jgi:hypothetical protein
MSSSSLSLVVVERFKGQGMVHLEGKELAALQVQTGATRHGHAALVRPDATAQEVDMLIESLREAAALIGMTHYSVSDTDSQEVCPDATDPAGTRVIYVAACKVQDTWKK